MGQSEVDSEMWQLLVSFREEKVKAKIGHKFNSASLENFLLAWTAAVATPHANFPHAVGPERTDFYWNISNNQTEASENLSKNTMM